MVEILWHRRETRRQTEKTKLNLKHWKKPVYSTKEYFKSIVKSICYHDVGNRWFTMNTNRFILDSSKKYASLKIGIKKKGLIAD